MLGTCVGGVYAVGGAARSGMRAIVAHSLKRCHSPTVGASVGVARAARLATASASACATGRHFPRMVQGGALLNQSAVLLNRSTMLGHSASGAYGTAQGRTAAFVAAAARGQALGPRAWRQMVRAVRGKRGGKAEEARRMKGAAKGQEAALGEEAAVAQGLPKLPRWLLQKHEPGVDIVPIALASTKGRFQVTASSLIAALQLAVALVMGPYLMYASIKEEKDVRQRLEEATSEEEIEYLEDYDTDTPMVVAVFLMMFAGVVGYMTWFMTNRHPTAVWLRMQQVPAAVRGAAGSVRASVNFRVVTPLGPLEREYTRDDLMRCLENDRYWVMDFLQSDNLEQHMILYSRMGFYRPDILREYFWGD